MNQFTLWNYVLLFQEFRESAFFGHCADLLAWLQVTQPGSKKIFTIVDELTFLIRIFKTFSLVVWFLAKNPELILLHNPIEPMIMFHTAKFDNFKYRISASSLRGNYSFLEALFETIIQRRKLLIFCQNSTKDLSQIYLQGLC